MIKIGSALLLAAIGASPAVAQPEEPYYLHFSGQQKNGIYLRDLKLSEVRLQLNGEPVRIRFLGSTDVETAFAILIENGPRTARYSVSMPHRGEVNAVDQIRYGLMNGFLDQIVTRGPVLLAEFDKELQVIQEYTDVEDLLVLALHRMKPAADLIHFGEVPLGRMLGRGVDLLRKRSEKRKVLVVFTATVDRQTLNDLGEYRDMLRHSDIDLYIVSFATRFASGTGYTPEERANYSALSSLVGETGGKLYVTGQYVFVTEFMEDLASRLVQTYTVGFYIKREEEPEPHAVELIIDRPQLRLEYRRELVY